MRLVFFLQLVVPGTTTTTLLPDLLPDHDYEVGVVALYSDGEGPSITDAGKTRKKNNKNVLSHVL